MSAVLTPSQEELFCEVVQPGGELDNFWYYNPEAIAAAGRISLVSYDKPEEMDDVRAVLCSLYTRFGLSDQITNDIASGILDIPPDLKHKGTETFRRSRGVTSSLTAYAALMRQSPDVPTRLANQWGVRSPQRYQSFELLLQAAGLKPNPEEVVVTAVHDWTQAYSNIENMLSSTLVSQRASQFYEAKTSDEISDHLDRHASNNDPAKRLFLVGHGTYEGGKLVLSSKPGTEEHEVVEPSDLSDLTARGVLGEKGYITLAGCCLAQGGKYSTAAHVARESGHTVYACEDPIFAATARRGKPVFFTGSGHRKVSIFIPKRTWRFNWNSKRKIYSV